MVSIPEEKEVVDESGRVRRKACFGDDEDSEGDEDETDESDLEEGDEDSGKDDEEEEESQVHH